VTASMKQFKNCHWKNKRGENVKKKFKEFSTWAQRNWLAIIIVLSVCMMMFLCLVMFSWLYGYWSNALANTKFELSSCWQGISVVVAGLGGIVALAKACWTKYSTDSKYNSAAGAHPYKTETAERGK